MAHTPKRVLTINAPLILKARVIIFFSQAKHIMRHFAGAILGSKRSGPPRKTPRNTPLYVLPQTKILFPGLAKSEVHWYFYVPKREREREGGREREREREGERGRERGGRGERGETRDERQDER